MGAVPAQDDAFYLALIEDDPEELYENAPCAYLSTLPDGTIVKVNGTLLAWTGYQRQDLIGRRRFQDLLSVGDRIFYETHVAPLLHMQGGAREIAVDLTTNGGGSLPVLVNLVLKTDDTGRPLIVRTAMFDARERRSYEAELLAARARAQESEARARSLATTLQSTLLPPEDPDIPGFDVAGGYRPAGDGSEVGGDFYDIFETGRGTWGVVLGDVGGKGAVAATVTAVARYTIRAAAATGSAPSRALRLAHEALLRHDPDRLCTAVFMVIEPGERPRVTVASAGHHLPVLRHADGAIAEIGHTGSMLGMLEEHHTTDVTVELSAGETLVLYTDGIVEARRGGQLLGEERLFEVIALRSSSSRDLADELIRLAVDFQNGVTHDDIAVVVMTVPRSHSARRP